MRLYRCDYTNFQDYCRANWEYGERYVNRLISAAQICNYLGTNCSELKPGHESQVRPWWA